MKVEFANGSVVEYLGTQEVVRGNRSKVIKFVEDDDSRECVLVKMANKLFSNGTDLDGQEV